MTTASPTSLFEPQTPATTHVLKTWPSFFQAVWNFEKCFEVRRDDRGFKVNDTLILQEFDPDTSTFSGRQLSATIRYILSSHEGLSPGFVCLQLMDLKKLPPGNHYPSGWTAALGEGRDPYVAL